MLSIFKKDPIKKLNTEYSSILEKAQLAQRKGDIKSYSDLTAKAEDIGKKIDKLKEQN